MRQIDFRLLEIATSSLAKAIIEPAAWPEVMDEICRSVGATGAVLLQSDVRTSDVPRTRSVDEMITFYFNNNWHINDLRAHGLPLLLNGECVFTDQDCVTSEVMLRSSYYNDFVYRTGFEWFAGVGFHADSALWVMAIQRSKGEGLFEAEDKQILRTLSRPLTEIATLSKAVGQVSLSGMTNALDRVGQAALAVDRTGSVIDINAAAQALFDDSMRVHNRRLTVQDKKAESDLELLNCQLRATADLEALTAKPILIRRELKAPILLRTLPISGPARSTFLGARALLTLTELCAKRGPDPIEISRAFSLTRAEARLASLIVGGLSPEVAANRLGISVITARNQIKAAMAKVGTHRQSGFVALLSRL
jgi:DNA-binding CsgD family transcriptional regulator